MGRKSKDWSGQKFGKLTAIEIVKNTQVHRHTLWKLQCECKRYVIRAIYALARRREKNSIASCKVCNMGNKSHAWKGCGELPKDVYNTIYHGAIARNLEFNVTIEYLWELYEKQGKICAYTGFPIRFNKTYRTKKEKTASLDRIDSSLGYVQGNLQWVSKDVNKLKKNIPHDTFIAICHAVAKHTEPINHDCIL